MRWPLLIAMFLLFVSTDTRAGFRVPVTLPATVTSGDGTLVQRNPDKGNHRPKSHVKRKYRGRKYQHNIAGLVAFVFSVAGGVALVRFFQLLKLASPIAWWFLLADVVFGGIAFILGINTPKSHYTGLAIFATFIGLLELVPAAPLLVLVWFIVEILIRHQENKDNIYRMHGNH